MSSYCSPDWHLEGKACPYGTALPALWAPVTWPHDPSLTQFTAVVISCLWPLHLPFLVGLFLAKRGTRELSALLFLGIVQGLVECVASAWHEAKPEGSCSTTCGMPSDWAAASVGLWWWLTLEALAPIVFVYLIEEEGDSDMEARCKRNLPPSIRVLFILSWSFLLLPVPIARVVLNDHSSTQILVASAIGICWATVWYVLMQACLGKLLDKIPCIKPNYTLQWANEDEKS